MMGRSRIGATLAQRVLGRISAYAVGGMLAVVLLGLLTISVWQGREAALQQAQRDTENIAGILEHDIAGKIHLIDYAVWEMVRALEVNADRAAYLTGRSDWLHLRLGHLVGATSAFVVDENAQVTHATTLPSTPGMSVADRDYFQWVRDHPGNSLYVSAPYRGRARPGPDGTRNPWVVSFTRRWNHRDGSFAGSVSVSIRLDQIASTFGGINVGQTGAVALWNSDFLLLARYPDEPEGIGHRRASNAFAFCGPERPVGTTRNASGPNMPARIATCRAVEHYPFYLTVGLGRDEVLSGWRHEALLYGAIALLCVGAIMALAGYVARTHAADLGGAEARLRDAVDSIGDSFALFDANDRLEVWNKKYIEQFPYLESLQPLAGRSYEELLRAVAPHIADAQGDIEEFVRGRLTQHRNPPPEPVSLHMSDGRWFLIFERRTSSGGTVGIRTDITHLKQHEKHLEQLADNLRVAKLQAENANRAKSRFLAAMSHELRTPLNAVIGFSEIIKGQILGPNAIERYTAYAQDIHSSGVHLLDLINDILDMSKIEAGRLELLEETVDIEEVVETCERMLQGRAREGMVALRLELANDLPLLLADRRAIKQVLLNLMSNAVKFTPPAGSVIVRAGTDRTGAVWLTVADDGCGIAADQLAHVFEPFRRAERGQTPAPKEGTGLGLAISKGLIDGHGGTIELTSEPGRGTVVTVTFPASRTLGRRGAQAVA